MKISLVQHKQMLENVRKFAREATEKANRASAEAGRYRAQAEHYAAQIAEAEKRGMDGFDPDKFLKKRRMTEDRTEYLKQQGYQAVRRLDDGRYLALLRMMFTTGLYVISADVESWERRYCYESSVMATIAMLQWDGAGDPPGPWVKEKPSERLGPGATKE